MIAYLASVLFFTINFFISKVLQKKIDILKKKDEKIKREMIKYIEKKEEEHQLKNIELFRLRVLELFSKIKNDLEKEDIRKNLKRIVRKNNGQPKKNLALEILKLSATVIFIYSLIFFFNSTVSFVLAIVVNILVIFFWIARKRYFFSIVFGLLGVFLYFKMPGHILLFIGLSMFELLFKQFVGRKNFC